MNHSDQTTSVRELLEFSKVEYDSLNLEVLSKKNNFNRKIKSYNINRPGMSLFGFFEFFASDRLQLFGLGECAYIKQLIKKKNFTNLKNFFEYDIPTCIFCHGYIPPEEIISLAANHAIPILSTTLSTSEVTGKIQDFFHKTLAPKEVAHGVLMEIFGMGVFIVGESGVGKSECALELIERGHRFIADDVVDIRLIENSHLVGSGSKIIAHHMEIRGIGIINIAHLFGVSSIRNEKKIDLIIKLELINENLTYNRGVAEAEFQDILGVKIPKITIPIQPGTNIPILVETAAINQRLKKFGYNPAEEFNKKINSFIEGDLDD